MPGRISLLAVLLGSLALAGMPAAQASDRNAVIVGATVGALVGGSIAVQARHGHVPVYIEIGAPPPAYYYPAYPRYYAPPPVYYRPYPVRPYPVIVAPRYYFNPHQHKHHYRKYQRRQPGYGPRW